MDPNTGQLLAYGVKFSGTIPNSVTEVNIAIGLDIPTGTTLDNSALPHITVTDLGMSQQSQFAATGDPSGSVAGGLAISGSDVSVIDPTVNNDGLFAVGPAAVITGGYRPGNQQLEPSDSNPYDLLTAIQFATQPVSNPLYGAQLGDYSTGRGGPARLNSVPGWISGSRVPFRLPRCAAAW